MVLIELSLASISLITGSVILPADKYTLASQITTGGEIVSSNAVHTTNYVASANVTKSPQVPTPNPSCRQGISWRVRSLANGKRKLPR
jgi:hypothetical protein